MTDISGSRPSKNTGWKALFILVLVTLLVACGDSPSDDGSGRTDDPSRDVIVNEDVRVLDASARDDVGGFELDTSRNEGEIRFDASSGFARDIEVGRILASEPIDGVAPYGFLQRVESKRTEEGQIVFGTSQATLVETFDKADITYEQQLDPDDIEQVEMRADGIELRTRGSSLTREQPLGFDFGVDFDRVLLDVDGDESTLDDQVTLDGEVAFNARARAEIDIRFLAKLERFSFAVDLDQEARLEIEGDVDDQFDEEYTVSNFRFGSFTIYVGLVPVVFYVTLDLEVGGDGQYQASFEARVIQETSASIGARYTNNKGWRPIDRADSSFSFTPPDLQGEGEFFGYAKPKVSVRIYGIAGPFVSLSTFVDTDAELYRRPFWRLGGGLDLGVGFEVVLPVVGSVAEYGKNFRIFREELDRAGNTRPTLEVLSPDDGVRADEADSVDFKLAVRDREQEFVDLLIRDQTGKRFVDRRVEGGDSLSFSIGPLCLGSQTFRVVATDDEGARTDATRTIVVENRVPTVTVNRGTADPPFPGGYLLAAARASDQSCEDPNTAEQDLIAWYVDGRRVGSSDRLLYRVPASQYGAGDTLTLQARYDDGRAVGRSQSIDIAVEAKPPGLDLKPSVSIWFPEAEENYTRVLGDLRFEGTAVDPEDGELTDVVWELKDGNNWVVVGRSPSGTFDHNNFFSDPNIFTNHTLRCTATDSAGQSVSQEVRYTLNFGG